MSVSRDAPPRSQGRRVLAAASLLLACTVSACGRWTSGAAATSGTPTFTEHVAPILRHECVVCHHQGGAGPFPLISYADVKRRARLVAKVTRTRYMPPWLPVDGHGDFVGRRRLSNDQIDIIQRWVAAGAPEGPSSATLPPVTFASGWQLGTPDLVLRPAETWTLPAEGGDVFRNFVLPVPIIEARTVRAVEILPGNPRLVHHANALVDTSGAGRERDAREPGPGFSGMDLELESDRFDPDSHFLFWKPGTAADVREIPWTIDPGSDLILNLHLRTSGKPEPIAPAVGLYFTNEAPTEFPMLLQLEHDGALDIPPGAKAFTVTDELQLPVPVKVLAVYPHAHYTGHEIQGLARLPDGSTRWLVHITDWNLDWQAVYQLTTPMSLPAGTVLSMRWTYDNSTGNRRNPNDPPRRIVAGNRASDEMSHLWVQVLPEHREDRVALQQALMLARLRKYPGDFVAHANLGSLLLDEGRNAEAIDQLRAAVRVRPDQPAARNNLALALRAAGELDAAIDELIETTRVAPTYLQARYNLATSLLAKGKPREAIVELERVLAANPDDAAALSKLGSALAMSGRYDEATRALTRSLRKNPGDAYAHYNLGLIAIRRGRTGEAEHHLARALAIDPSDRDIAAALAEVRAAIKRRR
jgi:Flp pilus assembly protein TadD